MLINNNDYFNILENIKESIKAAQYKAVLGVNREQIMLYWHIKVILKNSKWGNKFIENPTCDIKSECSAIGVKRKWQK